MNEESFELTLGEMNHDQDKGQGLELRWMWGRQNVVE